MRRFFPQPQGPSVSKADDIFWREFGVILGALVLFGIVMFFLARAIAGDAFQKSMNSPTAVAGRIAPVGAVRVGDPAQVIAAAPAAAMPAAAPAAPASEGESVYNGACMACHATGAAGAPKLDDEAAWAPRIALGEDALVASVVNGKGAMPPKGGNPALTEDQIRAAVSWMLGQSSGGVAAAAATQAVETAKEVVASATQAAGTAAASVAAAAGTAAQAASDAASAVAGAAQQVVEQAAGTATTTAASEGKPGEQVYNMACVACHAAGVANAPKLGDKAAWESRAAAGLEALVASVVNGKGAMPPKAGQPALTQADIANSVRYMLEKSGVSTGG